MKRFVVAALLLAAFSTAFPGNHALAENIVLNGGFEDIQAFPQPFVDWTVIEGFTGSLYPNGPAHSGSWGASFAATHQADDTLLQSIPTVPGNEYLFDFWLINPDYGEPPDNDFTALWNGVPVVALVNAPYFSYTEYTYTLLAAQTSTELRFVGANAPGAFVLDDVSVTLIPEPSSIALAAMGLVGFAAAWGWRRKR